jgi:hypothetical protein
MTLRSLLIATAVLGATPAFAQSKPWTQGVTDAQQKQATAFLEQGNKLFIDRDYQGALAKYRDALKQWNHPAIRFNVVRVLIQTGETFQAADELALALKYGADPLEDEVYQEALNYQKLLANQIATVEISCEQDGVALTLDGVSIGTCPTTKVDRIKPGTHQLVGEKKGFVTGTVQVLGVGGETNKFSIKLIPLSANAKIVHRFPQWQPWAVLGGGLLVTGIGAVLELSARTQMDSYNGVINANCTVGCNDEDIAALDAQDTYDSAQRYHTAGIIVMSVGAAVVVTGGVMLYLNRGRTVYESEQPARVGVTPTDGGGMLSLSGGF